LLPEAAVGVGDANGLVGLVEFGGDRMAVGAREFEEVAALVVREKESGFRYLS
jgi:hypothetical protein